MNDLPSSKQKWTLTPDSFEALLAWLHADRERAGEKYEQIRAGLIKGFIRHGCRAPEELADETIDRVTRRLPEIIATYKGDPAAYFYGVAHNIRKEYLRKPVPVTLMQTGLHGSAPAARELLENDDEQMVERLRACVGWLTPAERELILGYYCGERQVRIRLRKELAERLGIKLEILRLRAQRIRQKLKGCVETDMNRQPLAQGTR